MKFYQAVTAPVNPPSALPILTSSQLWQALVEKCHKPHKFVKAIADCEVLEESDVGLTRVVTFKPGMGPPAGKATEVITYRGQITVGMSHTPQVLTTDTLGLGRISYG
jgi:hypothetical protein